ncbi:unnamed protein product [Rotaria sp. Silwood2]|nr:unnamed protein product [Rotaria sp. Silwood2]CAF3959047.1 unnamed protein product [Rotaria sp. Silwood2]
MRIIDRSRFEPSMDIHLIEIVNTTRSLNMCIAICDRHIICQTADYSSTTKQYRLFESLASAGTFIFDPTTTIRDLNYCQNDVQIEPEYIHIRSGRYTILSMFELFK